MPTISIANNKGGVGKSSTSVNLGAALVQLGKSVLLIDLDSQGSLSVYYGLEPLELEHTMYDVIVGNCSSQEALIKLNNDIDILPASIDLSIVELDLITRHRDNMLFALKDRLTDIIKNYDYTIIDCGPSFGLLNLSALIASDYVISPCVPEYLALRGLELLLQTVDQAKEHNPNLQFMGVLITMFNSMTTHHSEVCEEIRKRYKVFTSVVKKSIKFADACLARKSILEYAPKFEGSISYLEFAKEVIENAQKTTA